MRILLCAFSLLLCAAAPEVNMPDPSITPGAVMESLSLADICQTKWGLDKRHVTASMKRKVYEAYGYKKNDPRCPCEVDHLIGRELGGADVPSNLMIQSYSGPWNAHMKDQLENRLHREVCTAHSITLAQAWDMLAGDWRKAYIKYFGAK